MLSRKPPRPVIRGVSLVWSGLSALARDATSRGWLDSTRLSARVVSVGNIQAGGAGKTPLVAQIAREAHERGLKTCVLCRGYGGGWESSGGMILPGQAAPATGACGDEAALLHQLAPMAAIGVGADRVAQFEKVREAFGPIDLVVLDDGFQHWKIKKDLEIVAVTSQGPSDVPFRDAVSALARADLIVWTKGAESPRLPPGKPLVRLRYRLAPPQDPAAPFWLVSGVADAPDVERLARLSGYRIQRHVYFPDHARYAEPMVRKLIADATGVKIAVTGKDWVKWRELSGVAALEGTSIFVLEPELEWLEGREQWNRLLWG